MGIHFLSNPEISAKNKGYGQTLQGKGDFQVKLSCLLMDEMIHET